MTPEVANMIAQFMQRVQLQAAEIDAFQTCMQSLRAIVMEAQQDEPEQPSVSD